MVLPVKGGRTVTASRYKWILKKSQDIKFNFAYPLTAYMRLTPSFIIIGTQKGGSTSLYNYLAQHPHVSPSLVKEISYFDLNFSKGDKWYRNHFPSYLHKAYIKQRYGREITTGEASISYLAHPDVPERVYNLLPDVKLIAILRNPIDRAYSHYQHRWRGNREARSFEEIIKIDKERLQHGWVNLPKDVQLGHSFYSYLPRSLYVEQLKVWMKFFRKEQFLFLKSEDFFADTAKTVKQVINFLGLPDWELKEYPQYNAGGYKKSMADATRDELVEFFKPYNQCLYEYLERDFGWDQ
jgi:hypothetical protein